MAQVTLADLCVRLLRCPFRNHFEVLHVVAGRGLVALGAIGRARRRVLEGGYRPLGGGVARSAISPEQAKVLVFRQVAARTVETGFKRRDEWVEFRQQNVLPVCCSSLGVRTHADSH